MTDQVRLACRSVSLSFVILDLIDLDLGNGLTWIGLRLTMTVTVLGTRLGSVCRCTALYHWLTLSESLSGFFLAVSAILTTT